MWITQWMIYIQKLFFDFGETKTPTTPCGVVGVGQKMILSTQTIADFGEEFYLS